MGAFSKTEAPTAGWWWTKLRLARVQLAPSRGHHLPCLGLFLHQPPCVPGQLRSLPLLLDKVTRLRLTHVSGRTNEKVDGKGLRRSPGSREFWDALKRGRCSRSRQFFRREPNLLNSNSQDSQNYARRRKIPKSFSASDKKDRNKFLPFFPARNGERK